MSGTKGILAATYRHFYEASNLKWLQAASQKKYERLLTLYGDDTFTKIDGNSIAI
jgi:hypothetical protein